MLTVTYTFSIRNLKGKTRREAGGHTWQQYFFLPPRTPPVGFLLGSVLMKPWGYQDNVLTSSLLQGSSPTRGRVVRRSVKKQQQYTVVLTCSPFRASAAAWGRSKLTKAQCFSTRILTDTTLPYLNTIATCKLCTQSHTERVNNEGPNR